ncbi:hypothetical protein DRQ33_04805, partial [bacterium]
MSIVILKRVGEYNEADIQAILAEMLNSANLLNKIKSGSRVLIKPNLLSARNPNSAITTHPTVVSAVAKMVMESGAIPIIGDSPGGVAQRTKQVYSTTGISQLAQKLSIETISLEAKSAIEYKLPDGEILYVSRILDEIDCIINIPKLKTHSLVLTTFATKNLYGLVPGFRKSEYHKIYPTPTKFSWLIAELYQRVKEKVIFSVLDGIIGMDGDGPSAGRVRKFGIIAVSDSCSAMDCAIENLVGLSSHSPVVRELERRKLLPEFELNWFGEPIESIDDFKIPSNWLAHLAPSWLTRI